MKKINLVMPHYVSTLMWPFVNLPHDIKETEKGTKIDFYYKDSILSVSFAYENNFDRSTINDDEKIIFCSDLGHHIQQPNDIRNFQNQHGISNIIFTHLNGESVDCCFNTRNPFKIEKMVNAITDRNDLLYLTSSIDILDSNPNVFYHPFINFYKWHQHLGYNFLNFYENKNKTNLVGMYYNKIRHSESSIWRSRLYYLSRCVLGDNLEIFKIPTIPLMKIAMDNRFGSSVWQANHSSSYLDYNQCVANIIYESEMENDVNDRTTEKTLKAILFAKTNTFFIWYGPGTIFQKLNDYGYWFLNSEFYDKTSTDPVLDSVMNSLKYLMNLKNKYKSDNDVHMYLLDKYQSKLEQTSKSLDHMINNCPFESNFLEKIISL